MKDYFTFGSISSADFFVYVYDFPFYETPEKRIEEQTIPGRNGELILNDGFFNGRSAICKCYEEKGMEHVKNLRAALLSMSSYHRFRITKEPDIYRMGVCKGVSLGSIGTRGKQGTIEIEFKFKPQCWLVSGERAIALTADSVLYNPTYFDALPLIRVYGTGTLTVGDVSVTINTADEYTDIDSEIKDAYKGNTNCNSNIEINGYEFPSLGPGETKIKLGTGITKVEITPRWWTL